jgi:UDP-N-acetylglucosamine transferase subunit ALG13
VIFVALGTHEQPFERALDAVAALSGSHDQVIQHGHTPPRAGLRARWIEFGPYDEILTLMHEATAVVCHAGVGTILSALGAGKCPVVLPRLARFGEHVDDHQLQITEAFAARGIVVACTGADDIEACIERAQAAATAGVAPKGDLVQAVALAAAGARAQVRGPLPTCAGIPDLLERRN